MPRVLVRNFSISLDGFGAGPDQSLDAPIGLGGDQLHSWIFETRFGRQMIGGEAGSVGRDNDFLEAGDRGVGATIMGRNMFDQASAAAGGGDVRIGGGVSTIQQFLRAGLIDELGLAIVPILLGRGERLFDSGKIGSPRYECAEIACSSAVAHVRLRRLA